MLYKKRIEELERKLEMLTRKLENNEAIGEVMSHHIGYTGNNNRFLGGKVKDNRAMISDLFEYLDVGCDRQPRTNRLVKRKEDK